jgi:hypothetical protein
VTTSLDPLKRQPQSNHTLSENIKPQNSPPYCCKRQILPALTERPLPVSGPIFQIFEKCLGRQEAGQYAESLLTSRDGLDGAEVTVKIKEQFGLSLGRSLRADELAHQRRAPKVARLVLIQHRGSRVLKTFHRGGSLRLILSIR